MNGFFESRPTRKELAQAILLALVCSLLFLRAGVLPSRALMPFAPERYEPLHSESVATAALPEHALERGNVSMGDKYNQSLAWDRILQDRITRGELPQWTRELGGGAPFVPQMAQVYQPWNLLLAIGIPSAGIYGVWWLLHQVLFGVLAWYFLRRLGTRQSAALFGLCCAALCLWTQARVHHNVIVTAALPLFPLLTTIGAAFADRRAGPARVGCIALGLGLSWSGGFAPVSLQCTYLCAGFALLLAIAWRRPRPLVGIGLGFALGAALAAAQMIPTLLAATRSARPDYDAATLATLGLELRHLWTAIWPDLLHWPAQLQHVPSWSTLEALPPAKARLFNWPESVFALGFAAVLGILAALTHRRFRLAAGYFATIAFVAFGMAMATTPFLEFSGMLPGAQVGDMRRFLFAFSMAAVVLAAIGIEQLETSRRLRLVGVLFGLGVAAFSAWQLYAPLVLDDDAFRGHWAERLVARPEAAALGVEAVRDALGLRAFETPANRAALIACYARTAIIASLTALALWRLRSARLTLVLTVLTATELLFVGAGTLVPVARDRVTTPPRTIAPALAATHEADDRSAPRPRFARLLKPDAAVEAELLPPNLAAYHGLEDVFAYHPLPSRRMEELFAALEPDTPCVTGGAGTRGFYRAESLDSPLLDLMGVRFVLSENRPLPADGRFVDATPAGTPPNVRLWERTEPWPRATFVDRAIVEPDRSRRLARLVSAAADGLRTTVVLEAPDAPPAKGDGVTDAEVEIRTAGDERVVVHVTTTEPGYVRLADPYDPGWTATVDGRPTPVFAADHRFRAVFVEPGRHEIVFAFDAFEVWGPRWLSAVALLAALGLIVFGRQKEIRGP